MTPVPYIQFPASWDWAAIHTWLTIHNINGGWWDSDGAGVRWHTEAILDTKPVKTP